MDSEICYVFGAPTSMLIRLMADEPDSTAIVEYEVADVRRTGGSSGQQMD